jgi:hypothetical protein
LENNLADKVDILKKLFEILTPYSPLQRPEPVNFFVGREEELKQLLDFLQLGQVTIVSGPPGIGKTALAAQAIWTLAPGNKPPSRFPDGIIWHDFSAQSKVNLALEKIVHAFDDKPLPTPQVAAQRVLAYKQALLVLTELKTLML